MRLFDGHPTPPLTLSQEQFSQYYQSASVISQESLSSFFSQVKDSLHTFHATLFDADKSRVVLDTLSTRFETQHAVKGLRFAHVADHNVGIPENFKGKYVEYVDELITAASAVLPHTLQSLDHLKLAVSSFINEYSENKVHTLYGGAYFKSTEKLIEQHRKRIAAFFPEKNHAVKAPIGKVLKSLNDIEALYNKIDTLNTVVNETSFHDIHRRSQDVASLVDSLIEQNTKTSVLLKNNEVKKELVAAIHTTAREVELAAYLHSNAVFFYAAFKKLSERLIELSKVDA